MPTALEQIAANMDACLAELKDVRMPRDRNNSTLFYEWVPLLGEYLGYLVRER